MAYTTWELFQLMIDAVTARVLARSTNFTEGTVYRFGRPPVHEDPDGTGAPNPLDRIESMVEALAFRERGRPVLRILRLWFDALFAQALDGSTPRPISITELRAGLPTLLREFADVIDACGDDHPSPKEIVRQWVELVEAGEKLMPRVWAGIDEGAVEDRPKSLTPRPVIVAR